MAEDYLYEEVEEIDGYDNYGIALDEKTKDIGKAILSRGFWILIGFTLCRIFTK